MTTGRQMFEDMGLNYDEALEHEEEMKKRKPRDRTICLCGHGITRHTEVGGRESCSALGYNCACRKIQPILEAEDIRPFICRTEGSGLGHALSRGILSATKKGQTLRWLEDKRICDKCKATGGRLTPMAVSNNGFIQEHDTGFNVLFCDECRIGK